MEIKTKEEYLQKLGFADSEISVYLAMVDGAVSAKAIINKTKMKRPTVYFAITSLEKRGLIARSGKENDSSLILQPLKRLETIAREKEDEAAELVENVESLISSLSTNISLLDKPKVIFSEGIEAVERTVMDIMHTKSKEVYSIAPTKNFFKDTRPGFVESYVEERIRRGIKTRNLWESETTKEIFKKYYAKLSDIRIMPRSMRGNFDTTIFLFDDKTLYVSSVKNCYSILIASKEHTDTMKAIFETIWNISKQHSK